MGRPIVMLDKTKPAALLREIHKGVPLKTKPLPIEKNVVADQVKLHTIIKKGVELKSVPSPNEELSEAVKEAFLADQHDSAAGTA
jgi:hypothetical protein